MRRTVSIMIAMMIAVMVGGPMGSVATAQTTAEVSLEIAATSPGVGCAVDVTASVTSDGDSFAGADVDLVLSDDADGTVISRDYATADDSGVAYLVYDTSSSYDGAKGWLSVSVNGVYLGGVTIWVTANGCDSEPATEDFSGTVVDDYDASNVMTEAEPSSSTAGSYIIEGAIAYQQDRGLSCEYASLAIATGMLGNWVDEYTTDDYIPLNDNPHWGYRGDITGSWGGTADYGVYAEAIQPVLGNFGFKGDVFYGGTDELKRQISLGRPVMVWIGMLGQNAYYDYTADGTRYLLAAGMHVVVIYGYDEGGVYVSDPGSAQFRYWSWDKFVGMWNVIDQMSLSIYR